MNKLQKKIREVEDDHAEESLQNHLTSHKQKDVEKALIIISGINVARRIAQAISSESMRALITFQEEKIYESLGFENFVDFLNNSEYAPMTKSQFYERKNLLENEGDATFDLLNSFSMPVSKRKLLGKGNIALDGETVIITGDDGEETTIEITDRTRLLETLTALADNSAELRRKVESQKTKLNKADDFIINLQDEMHRVKTEKHAEFTDFHAGALLNLVVAFKALEHQAEQLTLIEQTKFAPPVFETIAAQMDALSQAYNRVNKKPKFAAVDDEMPSLNLDAKVNDDELADLMD